ncbi:MAG: GTPase ObgE [Synergistaceae bacterium]|nr:GTPase ObgE [Synergistaceae bacterium]
MKFTDLVRISVKAGRGGNGALSFRREKFIPKGGPDGGDGGKGGDVILKAVGGIVTLADFEYNKRFQAGHAGHGSGAMRYGAKGEDLVIEVPCGTLVKDENSGKILADLVEPGQEFIAAKGGRGGRGNSHFASSIRRAPRFAEKGDAGEERNLILELKLIADIGLVGFPNAGKSSILAAISGAKPKIAGYPFTTLSPNLGVLAVDDEQIVIADVPGLIEGAHEDKGLGLQFLRHIERTRALLHVIDLSEPDALNNLEVIKAEFRAYGADLDARPYIIVGNKIDLANACDNAELLKAEAARLNTECFIVSALTGEGINDLIKAIVKLVRSAPRPAGVTSLEDESGIIELEAKDNRNKRKFKPVNIAKLYDGSFKVEHEELEKAVMRINFDHDDALMRFARLLKRFNVEEALEAAGAREGDLILIGEEEFEFEPDRVSAES